MRWKVAKGSTLTCAMIGILRETIVTARRVFGVREPTESVADIVMIA